MPDPQHVLPSMAGKPATQRIVGTVKAVLPFVIVLLPLLVLRELVRRHAVNIPFLDDWMYVSMDEKVKDGTLTLHDFFAAQMEHRMAFVRAVIMLFHQWWPADYVKQMMLSVALLTLTFANIATLVKMTTREAFARVGFVLDQEDRLAHAALDASGSSRTNAPRPWSS